MAWWLRGPARKGRLEYLWMNTISSSINILFFPSILRLFLDLILLFTFSSLPFPLCIVNKFCKVGSENSAVSHTQHASHHRHLTCLSVVVFGLPPFLLFVSRPRDYLYIDLVCKQEFSYDLFSSPPYTSLSSLHHPSCFISLASFFLLLLSCMYCIYCCVIYFIFYF